MNIQLPSELEIAAQHAAAAHGYHDISAYIADVLQRELETVENPKPDNWQNTDEWRKELREWAASHPHTNHEVDTDRDSIYGLRGL